MDEERIVAVGLLTQRDLDLLGSGFHRVFPVDGADCFGDLLLAIDEADCGVRPRDLRGPRQMPPQG